MLKRLSFGHCLLGGGVVAGLLGLILWRELPMPERYPPFALTSLLAMGFGAYEIWCHRRGSAS